QELLLGALRILAFALCLHLLDHTIEEKSSRNWARHKARHEDLNSAVHQTPQQRTSKPGMIEYWKMPVNCGDFSGNLIEENETFQHRFSSFHKPHLLRRLLMRCLMSVLSLFAVATLARGDEPAKDAAKDPKKEAGPLELKIVLKKTEYKFDGGGKTPAEYRKM